jgi:hypothetical protein
LLRALAAISGLTLSSAGAAAQSAVIDEPTVVTLASSADSGGTIGGVTLTASVTTRQGGAVPGGTIQFIDETTMAVLGWAGVAMPSITVSHLTTGLHLIRADYSGTADFLPLVIQPGQSALLAQRVLVTSEVAISSSQNPSMPGQLVTLTAIVTSGGGTPKGMVTFSDGSSVIAAHVGLDRRGAASFATSALADGPRAIVATYEGDGEHASAVSPPLPQDVGAVRIHDTMLYPGH